MYIGQPMTDEPIPSTEAPVIEVVAPPLPASNPVGWIVSGLLLFLAIVASVGSYAKQFGEPPAPALFDDELKYNVSLYASGSALGDQFAKPLREGLVATRDKANHDAVRSDTAAIVAIVASHELGESLPKEALDRLSKSEDRTSQEILNIYTAEVLTQGFVESLDSSKGRGFAFKLAKVHARELIDVPSGRDSLIDKYFVFKTLGVFGFLGLAFVAGIVCILMFLGQRANGRIVPVGFSALHKADGDRYMVRFAYYLGAFALLGWAGSAVGDLPLFKDVSDIWISVGVMVAIALVVVATLGIPFAGKRDRVAEIVGETWPMAKLVRLGLAGYLCTVPVLAVVLALIGVLSQYLPAPSHPITEDFQNAARLDMFAIFLVAAVLAPLIEEFTFRGLMLPALATRLKPIAAVLLCGFIFAAIHPQGPLIWPALMTTGAVAAYLRYWTGSLVPSIVLHVVHNGLIFVFSSYFL